MAATLGELAARFGCELHGDPDVVVNRVGTLSQAATDAITFLANSLYRAQLEQHAGGCRHSRAARPRCVSRREPRPSRAIPDLRTDCHRCCIRLPSAVGGVHASAVVAPERARGRERPDRRARRRRQRLHYRRRRRDRRRRRARANVAVGSGTRIGPRVTLLDGVRIGARCIVHPGRRHRRRRFRFRAGSRRVAKDSAARQRRRSATTSRLARTRRSTAARSKTPSSRTASSSTISCRSRTTCASAHTRSWPRCRASPAAPKSASAV